MVQNEQKWCKMSRIGAGLVQDWCRTGVGSGLVQDGCGFRTGAGLVQDWCRNDAGLVQE